MKMSDVVILQEFLDLDLNADDTTSNI